jgi:diguanylate cyclase (GGDEF)-like protein
MRRLLKLGLVPKFALLSLVLIVLLGVVLARSISSDIRSRNLDSAKKVAVVVSRIGVQSELSPEMISKGLSPAQVVRLDKQLQRGLVGRSVARIKVWSRDGLVAYSDEPKLIGRKFKVKGELRQALGGDVIASVSRLESAENVYDRGGGDLLEVYVPIVLEGSKTPAGAFELYLPYAPIAAAISHDTRDMYLLLAGGLGLLWVVLFRIVYGASRRLRRQARQNQHQALHDSLTDLPNRVLFRERVEEAIAVAGRAGRGIAVMLMDLDRFKEVNDTLGHHSGDLLLCAIGPRLRQAVRVTDVVARLGGDEFAVLVPGVDEPGAAIATARQLLAALENPFSLDALTVEVEASIGIALYPDHGADGTTLLQHADVAMYVAKEAHMGMELYAPEHDLYSRDRLTLVGELRHAVDTGELVLHYQPKVDVRTGAVRGVEALLRWEHPERGLMAPDEFLPSAEHTGLIRPLTSRVLDDAVAQCDVWRRAGHELSVSVNLSARNLHDVQLPDEIACVLQRWSLPPSALDLEITESAIMADPVRALGVARRLRELGVGLSIDDFGTGYSSLSYLNQFPITEIKIDKSFVIEMSDNDDDAAIVRSTIGLARNLGLEVVAEGVETQRVYDRLTELGCDFVQGFLVCAPVPAPELSRWLEARDTTAHAGDRSATPPLTPIG